MRTVKGTGKINAWENAPGKPITCPSCGKMLQRSTRTSSVIYCPRCSYPSFTYLDENIMIQCPARLLEADSAEEYIRAAVEAMQKLRRSPIRDYDYIPEDEPV